MAGKAEFQKAVPEFDETFDVVVVGYGFAGGVSAIQAARGGANVLAGPRAHASALPILRRQIDSVEPVRTKRVDRVAGHLLA